MKHVLLTGGAGFIGSHVAARLLAAGTTVRILDNLDPFYSPESKRGNLERLGSIAGGTLEFVEGDVRHPETCRQAVSGVDGVIHLAALAGVRPSIEKPARYVDVNVTGTQVLLDAMRPRPSVPLVFGGSSSVYGGSAAVPFTESDPVMQQVSPYAASKRAGELLCQVFHHLYGHPVTCLRFFTVYGPGQRPQMAIHKFSRMLLAGEPLPFFGDGGSARDYTYVSDIVDGVVAALARAGGFHIYNLGGSVPTTLESLVGMLERVFGCKALLNRLPDQAGDVRQTHADIRAAGRDLGYRSSVGLEQGLQLFAEWYLAERAAGRLA